MPKTRIAARLFSNCRVLIVVAVGLSMIGCATPDPIKQASELQTDTYSEVRASIKAYENQVDALIQELLRLDRQSNQLAQDFALTETISECPDDGSACEKSFQEALGELRTGVNTNVPQNATLLEVQESHKAEIGVLYQILGLLQQNQLLIDQYLQTDIGPDAKEISTLRTKIQQLEGALQ